MLLRSKGRLLAATGALLGLCLGGSGCQSGAPQCDACAPRSTSLFSPRGLLSHLRRHKADEDAPMPGVTPAGMRPAVTVMRPVPVGRPADSGTWSEVQRVSAEQAQPVNRLPTRLAVETKAKGDAGEKIVPVPNGGTMAAHAPPNVVVVHPEGLLPREGEKQALPPYVIEPPDILLIEATPSITKPTQPVSGSHLVRPDGTVGLGVYGSVFVAGLTIDEARMAVARQLAPFTKAEKDTDGVKKGDALTVEQVLREVRVDVIAYNSKVYYVVTDGGGYGAQIYRLPSTGNETVLDALAQVQGLPAVASKKKIWVARASAHEIKILPVDYCNMVLRGQTATNYQLYPGDRIYVGSDPRILIDSNLAKTLNPIERVFGAVLLGSGTVNSIQGRFGTGGGAP